MADAVCAICHDTIGVDDKKEAGELNSCNHRFCHDCISKWATIENRCPCCKERFETITKKFISSPTKLKDLPATEKLPGKVLAVEKCSEVNQRPVFEDPTFQNWIESLLCLVCGSAEHEEQLLLCDGCDCACHTYCAGLAEIPEGEWFCEACTAQRAAANHQRQNRRRQREDSNRQQQQQATRRRRVTVIMSDDEDDDDDVRIVHVRSGRREHQRRRTLDDNLDGFIVDDSEAEEELLESFEYDDDDEVLEEELELPVTRRRGRLRGGRQQAQRRQQQRFAQLDSDFEEEEEWKSDDDLGLDNPRAPSADGWRRAKRGPERAGRRQSGPTTNTGGAATAMHRAVQSVNDNWDDLRAGRVSFDQVLGRSGGGRSGFQIPRRSQQQQRQQSGEAAEVVDLTKSTPRDRQQRIDAGGNTASPLPQSLSARLRAELTVCRDRGARMTPRSQQPHRSAAAAQRAPPPRRSPAAATPGSGNNRWRLPNASPGSSGHRIRTVKDVHLQQEAARLPSMITDNAAGPSGSGWRQRRQPSRQPINGDGRSSPPPLQERLQARAAAEWGSSRLPEMPPPPLQRPQEMPPWRERPGQKQRQQQERPFYFPRSADEVPRSSSFAQAPPPPPPPPAGQQQGKNTEARPLFRIVRRPYDNAAAAAPSASNPSLASAPSSSSFEAPHNSGGGGGAERNPDSSSKRNNPRARAFEAIKPYVKSYLDDDIITTDQFRLISREATKTLYTKYNQNVDRAEEKEIRRIVDQALAAVVRNQVVV